ncbi:hypothetical protein PMAYCL1PPCAC_00196, partial [Pristionchus mayeri]
SRKCLICSAKTTECRLGIDCCRACCVFYRRVLASNSTPTVCVSGENRCVDKGTTVSCRKCRYEKFLEVFKNAEASEMENNDNHHKEEHLISERNATTEFLRLDEVRRTQFIDHTTFSFDQPSCSFTPIVERIRQSYSLMCQTRKSGESGTQPYVCQIGKNEHNVQESNFVHSTPSMAVANRRIFKSALYDFARMAFPDFTKLECADRDLCISECFEIVYHIDSAYRASHYFLKDLETHFDGYTTITKDDSFSITMDDCSEIERENNEPSEGQFNFVPMNRAEFNRVNPDSVEFTALIGLAFWDNQSTDANDELVEVVRKNRTTILKELHKVYRIRGNADYASRLGELLSLLGSMTNASINRDPERLNYSRKSEGIQRRIERAYKECFERRRSEEQKMVESISDRKIVPHPTETLYLANDTTPTAAFQISFVETRTFFLEAFPTLSRLSEAEQDALYKKYINKFGVIEMHYRTRQLWGDAKQYLMGSVLTVVSVHTTDQCLSEEEGGEHRELLKESIRAYVVNHLAIIAPLFKKAQITNKEFYALLALALCEEDAPDEAPAHIDSVLNDLHKEVLHDLQRYYKEEMDLDDFSVRLGNLITLSYCIRECDWLFLEYFRMHTAVFDQYKAEEAIKKLFL